MTVIDTDAFEVAQILREMREEQAEANAQAEAVLAMLERLRFHPSPTGMLVVISDDGTQVEITWPKGGA